MRGDDEQSGHLFSYVSPEQRVPAGGFFSATVINFRNPMLVGYGAGVRTTLMGF